MYCPKCGTELVKEAKFCSKCGNQVSGEVIYSEKIKEKIENSPIETAHQKESKQSQKDSQPCGSVSSKKPNLPKFIILGVVILSILCLLLSGKFLKSEGIESYYGVYNNGSSWYLIFTDGKTFSGDENKAEDAYLYLYNIISGQTLGKYFEDWNKNSSLISIGGILDVVGTDGYYVDFELLFEENNDLIMKYPNDETADYFTLVTRDVVSFMKETPQQFGVYSMYESYIHKGTYGVAGGETFSNNFGEEIPVVNEYIDFSEFMGRYTHIDNNAQTLDIDYYDFILSVYAMGEFRADFTAEVYVEDIAESYTGNSFIMTANDPWVNDSALDSVILTYVPADCSKYLVDTIYMESDYFGNRIYLRDTNSPRFQIYGTG